MQVSRITTELRTSFSQILAPNASTNLHSQIEHVYFPDATLSTPYTDLKGIPQIHDSYEALRTNNAKVVFTMLACSFDPLAMVAMCDVKLVVTPKAIGGVYDVVVHYVMRLQMEFCDDSIGGEKQVAANITVSTNEAGDTAEVGVRDNRFVKVASHSEMHATHDHLAQIPLVGGATSTLRSTLGILSNAGSHLLASTGILDMVPRALLTVRNGYVDASLNINSNITTTARSLSTLTSSCLAYTGVTPYMTSGIKYVRGVGDALIEDGRQLRVTCYSPTCVPGTLCYSPTCIRGTTSWISTTSLRDAVKGVYINAKLRMNRKE